MADGTIFEHEGLQAASIVTMPFLKTADSMARRNGYPGYHYAVMPHPIGNLRPDQIRQRAEVLLPEVLAILGITEGLGGN